jgi:D-lactate dehydrogenase
VRALADAKLRGAGLDVLPQEPFVKKRLQEAEDFKARVANHVLLRFPNVIVTPHNAYNTEAALERIIATTLANIEAFAQGKPQNVVSAH